MFKRLIAGMVACLLLVVAQSGVASAEESVLIPDAALRECLAYALHQGADQPITADQLATIDELACTPMTPAPKVTDLTGLEHLTNVTEVYLSDQRITDIGPLTGLHHLERLSVGGLRAADASALSQITTLRTLYLDGSQIADFRFLLDLPRLEGLTVSDVKADLRVIGQLSTLKTLLLGDNATTDYSFVSALPALTKLYVYDDTATQFDSFGTPPALRDLYISAGRLTDLSAIRTLGSLKKLSLIRTGRLVDLSPLSSLHDLTDFYSYGLGAHSLDALADLSALTNVKAINGKLTDASAIAGLTNLTELDVSTNSLTSLPDLSALVRLSRLEVSDNAVRALPGAESLRALTELRAAGMAMTTLPRLDGLAKLALLDVSFNQLTSLELTDLEQLTTLAAQNNRVASVVLRRMPSLTTLKLRSNRLSSLDVSSLPKLSELDLGLNEFTDVTALAGLPTLTSLKLDGNNLTDVTALAALPNLTYVDVDGNNLTDVTALAALPNLTYVDVGANHVTDVGDFGPDVTVYAGRQWITLPEAKVGTQYPVTIRGLGGAMPTFTEDAGTTVSSSGVTYSLPGGHRLGFDQSVGKSVFSGGLEQRAGPDMPWTKTQKATLDRGVPAVNSDLAVIMKTWTPEEYERQYHWYRDGKIISGATEYYYTLTGADLGHRVKASVTVIKDGYVTTTVWTSESGKVRKGIFRGDDPTIAGKAQTGQKLTATLHWSPTPRNCSYEWRRSEYPIKGAKKSSYTLTASDLGKRVDVIVTCDALGIGRDPALSKKTAKVTQGPVHASTPSIKGAPAVGKKLTVSKGSWGPGTITFTYQWLRDGKAISKATKSTYTLTTSDAGHRIAIRLTGDRSSYTAVSRTSEAVTVA